MKATNVDFRVRRDLVYIFNYKATVNTFIRLIKGATLHNSRNGRSVQGLTQGADQIVKN